MPELGRDNTFEQCIREIALAGFEGTEVGVKFTENTEFFENNLEIRGLRIFVHFHMKKMKKIL